MAFCLEDLDIQLLNPNSQEEEYLEDQHPFEQNMKDYFYRKTAAMKS